MATQQEKAKAADPVGNPRNLDVEDLTDREGAEAKDLQFPSIVGEPGVEVAERSQDVDAKSTTSFEKVFVTLRREWAVADQKERHAANAIACRQFLTNQGLRTDQVKVAFVGEEDVPGEPDTLRPEDRSVGLRYRVQAVPAVLVRSGGLVSEANLMSDDNAETKLQKR